VPWQIEGEGPGKRQAFARKQREEVGADSRRKEMSVRRLRMGKVILFRGGKEKGRAKTVLKRS